MYETKVYEQETPSKWVQLALRSVPPINRCKKNLTKLGDSKKQPKLGDEGTKLS